MVSTEVLLELGEGGEGAGQCEIIVTLQLVQTTSLQLVQIPFPIRQAKSCFSAATS